MRFGLETKELIAIVSGQVEAIQEVIERQKAIKETNSNEPRLWTLDMREASEIVLEDHLGVKAAVEKLMVHKDCITYQTKRGRAAISVFEWLQVTFIDTKILTKEEISIIPRFAWRQFDYRLAQAISDFLKNSK
jgi:hypothetical protein